MYVCVCGWVVPSKIAAKPWNDYSILTKKSFAMICIVRGLLCCIGFCISVIATATGFSFFVCFRTLAQSRPQVFYGSSCCSHKIITFQSHQSQNVVWCSLTSSRRRWDLLYGGPMTKSKCLAIYTCAVTVALRLADSQTEPSSAPCREFMSWL